MRHRRLAALAISCTVLASCASGDPEPAERVSTAADDPPKTFEWSSGAWEVIPAAPESTRGSAIWTGEELVLWGSPGASYDPDEGTWRALPRAPIGDRDGWVAVWTGTEVVYWGGSDPDSSRILADGAAYDPRSRSWRKIARSPLPPTLGAVGAAAAGGVVVWGGLGRCCPFDSVIHSGRAALYDPKGDRWMELPDVPSPWAGDGGGELTLTVGDALYVFRDQKLVRYDATAGAWEAMPPPEVPWDACSSTMGPVAMGDVVGSTIFTWSGGCAAQHGFAFDTASRTWRRIADPPSGGRVWTASTEGGAGAVLLLESQSPDEGGPPAAHAYVVAEDRWTALPPIPDGVVGSGAQLIWTGSGLVAWSGQAEDGYIRTGAIYRER